MRQFADNTTPRGSFPSPAAWWERLGRLFGDDPKPADSRSAVQCRYTTTAITWWTETELNGLSGFSVRLCHPTRSIRPELGGEEGNRTLIYWVQTNDPPVERLPLGSGCRYCPGAARLMRPCCGLPLPAAALRGAGCQNRTDFTGLQSRRMAPNAYPAKTGAEVRNPTGVGRLPCDCSVTELHRLEPERRFELRFGRYECPVLPIELVRLERARRIEPR